MKPTFSFMVLLQSSPSPPPLPNKDAHHAYSMISVVFVDGFLFLTDSSSSSSLNRVCNERKQKNQAVNAVKEKPNLRGQVLFVRRVIMIKNLSTRSKDLYAINRFANRLRMLVSGGKLIEHEATCNGKKISCMIETGC